MGRAAKVFFPLTILALAAFYFLESNSQIQAPQAAELVADTDEPDSTEPKDTLTEAPSDPDSETTNSSEFSSAEVESLDKMTAILSEYTKKGVTLADLVKHLKETGQDPEAVSQSNPDTGEMVIVRTQKPLPGTRYFHAQVFRDGGDQDFIQHMSFEFRKGESSMERVIGALGESFSDLPQEPQRRTGNFVSWAVRDGYILWVKRLEASDLEDNPFNAYTKEDLGTIRVALEVDVHGG